MQARAVIAAALGAAILLAAPAGAAPNVVASIQPVHSLVAGVMQGAGAPVLIVRGAASPHVYTLRPSEAKAIRDADVIFRIGRNLERFLDKPLAALPRRKAAAVDLVDTQGLVLHALREGGAWQAHELDPSGHDSHEGPDAHLWLDPRNAQILVARIAAVLSERDPEHADLYAANAARLMARLAALESGIDRELAPVRSRPFIVFHDAYQYFEKRFGLSGVGSITLSPEVRPGAKRIREIRALIKSAGAACVFAEPQFEPAIVQTAVEGTPARTGVLDPEGSGLESGPEAYFTLLHRLATNLRQCLEPRP